MKNCRVEIRVLIHSGTSQQWQEAVLDIQYMTSSESGYYYFKMKDGKSRYYPISSTIVIQLDEEQTN
jgi:hypothetical protein